jgi:hypothetical protein
VWAQIRVSTIEIDENEPLFVKLKHNIVRLPNFGWLSTQDDAEIESDRHLLIFLNVQLTKIQFRICLLDLNALEND